MKILHITCVRELTNGQRKQLSFEFEAARQLNLSWDTIVLNASEIIDDRFEIQIPKIYRKIFLRNLYAWIYIFKNKSKYDVIINRHMTFDPFVLIFGWFVKNRFYFIKDTAFFCIVFRRYYYDKFIAAHSVACVIYSFDSVNALSYRT